MDVSIELQASLYTLFYVENTAAHHFIIGFLASSVVITAECSPAQTA